MRAYEAGIKLARLEHFSKYANEENYSIDDPIYSSEPEVSMSSEDDAPAQSNMLESIPQTSGFDFGNYTSGLADQAKNYGNQAMDYFGSGQFAADDEAMGGVRDFFSNLGDYGNQALSYLPFTGGSEQPAEQEFTADDQAALEAYNRDQGLPNMAGLTPEEQEASNSMYLQEQLNPSANTIGNFDPNQNQTSNRPLSDAEQVMRMPRGQQGQDNPVMMGDPTGGGRPARRMRYGANLMEPAEEQVQQGQSSQNQRQEGAGGMSMPQEGGMSMPQEQTSGLSMSDPRVQQFIQRSSTPTTLKERYEGAGGMSMPQEGGMSMPREQAAPNMSMPREQAAPNRSMPREQAAPNRSMPQEGGMSMPREQAAPNRSMPQEGGMSMPREQAAPNRSMPREQAQQQQQQAPAKQDPYGYRIQGPDAGDDPSQARFNVQSGGYGKQFRRFKEQFGGADSTEAFKGLNYKDFASALGNRGLQVGDSMNASNVMQRLQSMRRDNDNRDQGMPLAARPQYEQLGIENRRNRDVNRGSIAAQRAAGVRRQQQPQQPQKQVRNRQDFTAKTTGQGPLTAPNTQFGQSNITQGLNLPKQNTYSNTKAPMAPKGQGYTRFGPGGGAPAPKRTFNEFED